MSLRRAYLVMVLAAAIVVFIAAWVLRGSLGLATARRAADPRLCIQTKPDSPGIRLYAVPLHRSQRPCVLVVISNESQSTAYLHYYMDDLDDDDNNPLQADVVDLESGTRVQRRLLQTTSSKGWCEQEFIPVPPGYNYGTLVDLNEYFRLLPKCRYKVTFTYRTLAPSKVGRVVPWKGELRSQPVTVVMP